MTGRHDGVISKVKSVANAHITFTHCMIHREALAGKKVSLDLNSVLQDAVRIINFIKSRALNTRLFVFVAFRNYTAVKRENIETLDGVET